jgi:hypothetical protein
MGPNPHALEQRECGASSLGALEGLRASQWNLMIHPVKSGRT